MKISAFVKSLNNLDYNKVPEKLLEKVFSKDYSLRALEILEVKARTLQSWYDNNLLPYKVLKGKKHTFNFVQLIWMYIVHELRKFGLPLYKIRKVKEYLLEEYLMEDFIRPLDLVGAIDVLKTFNVYDEYKEVEFKSWFKQLKKGEYVDSLENLFKKEIPKVSILFVLLIELILGSEQFFLSIDQDGNVQEFSSGQAPKLSQSIGLSTKIVLPLNAFFYKYIEDYRNIDFLKEIGMINKIEADLLQLIHNGDYDTITIKFRDKKADVLELSKDLKYADMGRINNIVARKKYQDITIKTDKGNIRYANVTKKIKLQ